MSTPSKWLLALAALLLSPCALALTSSGPVQLSNYTSTISYTTTWSVSAGDTLLVLANTIDEANVTNHLLSVYDGQGSYTEDAHFNYQTFSWTEAWRLTNATAGAHTITLQAASGATDYSSIMVVELTGTWNYNGWLGSNQHTGTSVSVTGTAPTGTGNLQFNVVGVNLVSDPPASYPVGWTGLGLTTTNQWPSSGWAYITSDAAQSPTWGALTSSAGWGDLQLAYQPISGACSHNFYSSTGAWAQPNGSSGTYWNVAAGTFSTPDCSTGLFWRQDGNKAAN